MFAKNKGIFTVAAALIGLWLALYFVLLVQPNWGQRETEVAAAQSNLDTWLKFYNSGKDKLPLPEASKRLAKQEEQLDAAQRSLRQIEFTKDFQTFTLAAAGKEDPNNYFDKKRNETRAEIKDRMGLKFIAGLDDLGFRNKVLEEPVPLNLARLFVLQRFCGTARDAGVQELQSLVYPKHRIVPQPEGSDAAVAKLYLVPLEVRFRATERQFAQLLYEVQRPSDAQRSYFALRGYTIGVKDAKSGMVDCWVALGALLTQKQAKDLKIEIVEEERPGLAKPPVDASRY